VRSYSRNNVNFQQQQKSYNHLLEFMRRGNFAQENKIHFNNIEISKKVKKELFFLQNICK